MMMVVIVPVDSTVKNCVMRLSRDRTSWCSTGVNPFEQGEVKKEMQNEMHRLDHDEVTGDDSLVRTCR